MGFGALRGALRSERGGRVGWGLVVGVVGCGVVPLLARSPEEIRNLPGLQAAAIFGVMRVLFSPLAAPAEP